MKHIAALVILFFTVSAFADDAPPVTIHQAIEAAEKSLTERGIQGQVYIESVSLNRSAVFGGETYWFCKWSHPLIAEEGKREIGVKVRMDGRATRLVKSILGNGKP